MVHTSDLSTALRKLLCPFLLFGALGHVPTVLAQPSIGVLYIEGRGVIPDAKTLASMVRIELEKTGRYNVIDAYDMQETLQRNAIDPNLCMGRACALQAGRLLQADKMLIGSVERFGERIAIILKIIDVGTGGAELSNTSEFLNVQQEMQRMLDISVKRLLGMKPDQRMVDHLAAYDLPIDAPVSKANLSGPRFGGFIMTGHAGERMRAPRQQGGFGMYKVTSMIGWQQEVQYLSSGNFQCLLEFLFTGSGLESGRFIPAFSFMNGFRLKDQGWEIAFGPTFRAVRMAYGYYDESGWHLPHEWDQSLGPNDHQIIRNMDYRGIPTLSTGLVLGAGKTFTSGQLNIPVNVYMVPRPEGTIYGVTMGFNVVNRQRNPHNN